MKTKPKSFNKADHGSIKLLAVLYAIATATFLELWPLFVQYFVNSCVHAPDSLYERILPKLATALPAIEPTWSFPLAPFDAAANAYYGSFMLRSYVVIALLALALVAALAVKDGMMKHDGTWRGPARSKTHTDGAYLESSHRAIRSSTDAWDGIKPAISCLVVSYIGREFRTVSFTNSVVFGSVGSGKSRTVVIPLICACISKGAPLFVSDTKGELRDYTEDYAKEHGYRIINLMFDEPTRSPNLWNPLGLAIEALEDASNRFRIDEAIAELGTVASHICPHEAGTSNPFWDASARSLFVGLALYLLLSDAPAEAKNLNSIGAMITEIDEDGITPLLRVRHLARTLPAGHAAKGKLGAIAAAPDETAESVIATLASKLDDYIDQRISKMLWTSDFSLKELAQPKTILYVSFAGNRGSYSGLISTLTSQIISTLMHVANAQGGRLEADFYLVMEEFVQYNRMPNLVSDIALYRGAGLRTVFIIQERAMLMAKGYSEAEVRSILACADKTLVLSVNDVTTAKEFSERIGKYWAESRSDNRSQSSRGGGLFSGTTSSGESKGSQLVPLLAPEDLLSWNTGIGNLLICRDGIYALPAPDLSATFLNEQLHLGDEDHNNALRARKAAQRPLLNTEPAPTWLPDCKEKEAAEEEDDFEFETSSAVNVISSTYNPLRMG